MAAACPKGRSSAAAYMQVANGVHDQVHTLTKAAFGAIEWGIDVMADLLYYGFKAIFEVSWSFTGYKTAFPVVASFPALSTVSA